jgi:DNA invertase Pin-like site-specific DNA recombinase
MAQQAICSSYIASQQHKGWHEIDKVYEDAAQSGGNLERPALQELLADIERGQVDVVVVYKLDRLSRSLLDFVRLMDVFQRYGVSFVCITQNFDTADSLGRLVMNVLLTFAQFEREMTADRIRDKRRAMALKGLWTGGRPPLGYDLIDHKLVVNDEEASIVRFIFDEYLKSGNLTEVERTCRAQDLYSKSYVPTTGVPQIGIPLKAATIRTTLMNPVYAGFIAYGGELHRGLHRPIIRRSVWEDVASLRDKQIISRASWGPKEELGGLIYDCFGRSMSANRLWKRGKLRVFYRSNQSAWGMKHQVKRMAAN